MSSQIYKNINVTNLLLNPSNPRFNPVEHQAEAINAMILDQQDKLLILARHIALYGLNPSDLILVKPHNKQWVVREGNRRVTALKLVNEPSLIPSDFPKLKKDFNSLNITVAKNLLENIPCVILHDEDEINEWVRLKHTGQNEGSGTVSWDAHQTSRFRATAEGKPDMRLTFLDELRHMVDIPQSIKDKLSDIKKTNFDRLLGDPNIRKILGIEITDNTIHLKAGINPFLIMVLSDLVREDLNVGRIYYKKDRLKYIEELKQRAKQETAEYSGEYKEKKGRTLENSRAKYNASIYDTGTSAGDDVANKNAEVQRQFASVSHTKNSSKRPSSYHINRKTLVPAPHKLTITHARILKIFNELKSISVDEYPNAVAVLFRVFIELSADCFISKKEIRDSKTNVDSKLSVKIDAVAGYLKTNEIMTKHELRAVRQMTASKNQTQSIRTFHSYIHNKDVTPSSTDLKSAWDDIWPFIEKVWGD